MQGLQQFAARENLDPNSRIIKVNVSGMQKFEQQALGPNFDAQSIHTDVTYNWSAVGEMNNQELDLLDEKNKKRIKEIEKKYFYNNSQILTAKQIMREQQDTFETRERFKDASINYPTYGRGLK
jgi:hypothetical protein